MRHYFTPSMACDKPEPSHKICQQFEAVTLQQRARNNFAVRYGKEVHADLSYAEACDYLGRALMHQAACESKLDNRMPGER